MKPVLLMLTCANDAEANTIVDLLLDKKLIVCAKKSSVSSSFYWKGARENSQETLLLMDSHEELFDHIEKEIGTIHSYETFNLIALPVAKTSRDVKEWMEEGLKKD